MKQFRLSRLAVLVAAIGFAAAPELSNVAANTAYAEEAMRPEIGKLVQSAGELLKSKKYKDAMAKLRDADGIGGKTANESFTIERMRLSIASQSGENDAVIRSAEAIIATNKLSGKEQLLMIQTLANAYYKAGNYPKASAAYGRYFSEGGTDGSLRQYMIYAMSQGGDSARAMKEVQADLAADEKAGRAPSLANLEFYSNAALKQKDMVGYSSALEKMIAYHGKKEYWVNLLNNLERKPGYSERLSLDLYRLKLAVGQVTKTSDFMEISKLAVLAGYPAEALKIIEIGYKSGALGAGAEAERHNRLREMAKRTLDENTKAQAANEVEANKSKDGTALANLGYSYVTSGQFEKGIAMLEQGISKDGMKFEDDAKLHLGMAYLQAGKKSAGIKALKAVKGTDGTADLARYWIIYANQSMK